MPPPGKSDLLPPNRSGTSLCHHRAKPIYYHRTDQQASSNTPPPGKGDLLPPNRSRSCTAPPPGKTLICFHRANHRALIRHHPAGLITEPQFATTGQIKSAATEQKSPRATTGQLRSATKIADFQRERGWLYGTFNSYKSAPIAKKKNSRCPRKLARLTASDPRQFIRVFAGALISLKPALMGASVH